MRWLKLHYPKLLIFLLAIVLAYIIFSNEGVFGFISQLGSLGYAGVFIAGILLTFGFTAPFAVGFFIALNPSNVWLSVIIGGLGAVLGDLIIFNIFKVSFMKEFKRLENTKLLKETSRLIDRKLGHKLKVYLVYLFAEIAILSPLPDELGILMIAGLTKAKQSILGLMSFVLHTLGILILIRI